MVAFHFLPCDRVPFSGIECSRYELNARIVYPPSYGDKRTEIQKVIECRSGVGEIPNSKYWTASICSG